MQRQGRPLVVVARDGRTRDTGARHSVSVTRAWWSVTGNQVDRHNTQVRIFLQRIPTLEDNRAWFVPRVR